MIPEQLEFGTRLFGALANPARIGILEHLSKGPASVKEISRAVGLKQSMTSQHLAVLLAAGIVEYSASGNMLIYELKAPKITHILQFVEEFYDVQILRMRELLAQHTRNSSIPEPL